ncbi:unnamed protein product [Lota lota]
MYPSIHLAVMLLHISSIGFRSYLGIFLLNSIAMATHGLNLNCTNDFDRLMSCQFSPPPDETDCTEYHLNTKLALHDRFVERNCNLTRDPVRTGTCSCSLTMEGFRLTDIHNTTLWKAGYLVESKNISVLDNIKPKAPTVTSVRRDPDNGDYLVEWDTNYKDPPFNLKTEVTYCRRGKNSMEAIVLSETPYHILGEFLEPSTEYQVNMRSWSSFYSESSEDFLFTTRVSSSTISAAIVLSLCVAAMIITSSLFLLLTRFKKKWCDNVGKYKNSTLLVMVQEEPKVLIPQKPVLCYVYVDSRKEDKDDKKPCSRGEYSHRSSGADSVSSSLGNSQKVSVDIISNVENAMQKAFPQVSLLPTTAPWLFMGHNNPVYNPGPWTSSLCSFENWNHSMAPPFQTQGLSGALPAMLSESFYNSKVPIFQLTRQRQPLVSRHDSSYLKTADSVSSFPTDALQVDLEHSSSPSDATSSSILSGVGSSVSGVCSTGAVWSETLNGSLLGRAADPPSMTEHVYSQEEPSVKVCGSNLCEEPRPAPACSLVPMDDDYQPFQSVVRGPGELIPEAQKSAGQTF